MSLFYTLICVPIPQGARLICDVFIFSVFFKNIGLEQVSY